MSTSTPSSLNIMLIDDEPGRAVVLREALTNLGHQVISRTRGKDSIYSLVESFQPDVVIVDTDSPDRDVLEDLAIVNDRNPKPMLIHSDRDDQSIIEQSIKAGASAYIVKGIESARIHSVLNVAIARFKEFQALKSELLSTKEELDSRKVIDRAKGLLIKHKGIDEQAAYSTMRKLAMNKSKPLSEVAADIIDLLG